MTGWVMVLIATGDFFNPYGLTSVDVFRLQQDCQREVDTRRVAVTVKCVLIEIDNPQQIPPPSPAPPK